MRARIVLAIVIAAALMVPLLARARHLDVSDRNDVRGLLDIQLVEMFGTTKPSFKVNTHGRWTTREIFERGFVLIFFDVRGTQRSDYYALAHSTGPSVVGTLYRDRPVKRDYRVASINAWRVGKRSLSMKVPLRKMNFGSERVVYRWYAETLFTGEHCRRVCFDLAPNDDVVVEPRPGATPTSSSG
jgi:hypothetical protein